MAKSKSISDEFIAVAVGIFIIAVMGFLIFTQMQSLQSVQTAIQTEQTALSQSELHLQQLRKLEKDYPSLQEQVNTLQNKMPKQAEEDKLLDYMQSLSKDADVHLLQVSFKDWTPQKGYTEMPASIVVEGRYKGVLDFLSKVRDGERALRINDMKIGQGRELFPQVRVDMSVSAFYQGTTGAQPEEKVSSK